MHRQGSPCIMHKQQRGMSDHHLVSQFTCLRAWLQERDWSWHAGATSSESCHPYSGAIQVAACCLTGSGSKAADIPQSTIPYGVLELRPELGF